MKTLALVGFAVLGLALALPARAAPLPDRALTPAAVLAAESPGQGQRPGCVVAQADDEGSGEVATPTGRQWYGWQILIADGASWLVMLLTAVAEPAAYAGTVGYFFGGPIVHWSHGRVGIGFASLGLRAGMPTAGFLAGLVLGFAIGMGDGNSGGDAFVGVVLGYIFGVIGGALGILGAQAIDVAVFAWETVRPEVAWKDDEQRMRALAQEPGLAVAPILAPRRDGGFAGLAVTF